MSLPRFYQQIEVYTVAKNEYGDNSYERVTTITGKINLGTRIVKDSRGEDIQEVARLWADSKYLLTKGQAVLYNNIYYLLDDVKQTKNLSGTDFFQFVVATKTSDTDL